MSASKCAVATHEHVEHLFRSQFAFGIVTAREIVEEWKMAAKGFEKIED
jgi:hypothetical protein